MLNSIFTGQSAGRWCRYCRFQSHKCSTKPLLPHSPVHLLPGELLPSSHPADEDEPNLLLVPGLPVLSALRPPGGAVPTWKRWPAVCDCHQRHRCGHGREEQLLWGISRQLDEELWGLVSWNNKIHRHFLTFLMYKFLQRRETSDIESRQWASASPMRGEPAQRTKNVITLVFEGGEGRDIGQSAN